MRTLSVDQARRIALAAQGFVRARPAGTPNRGHLRRLFDHVKVLQIDSVNVLTRAHYVPGWSRLGGYDRAALDGLAFRRRELFEYWGHEASLLPVDMQPLLRWRMRQAEEGVGVWRGVARFARDNRAFVEHVYAMVRDRGPLTAGQLAEEEKRAKEDWGWNWSKEKTALEHLFWTGRVSTSERRNFERRYDITERVLPQRVLDVPTPSEDEAHRQLLLLAADACGVGTASDLADYFRIRTPQARPRLAELVEDGALEEVAVRGWRHPAYLRPGLTVPRRINARALLVPFDPLIWERDRTERLFDFRYRIEIYVPPTKRVHGYYVLPFLLGDRLVARVDLKSDRQSGVLVVQTAHAEPTAPGDTAVALAAELQALAEWLGLGGVAVRRGGDLAAALAAAVAH